MRSIFDTTLETERLILRTWSEKDFESYAKMSMDREVSQYLTPDGKPPSRPDMWRSLAMVIGHWYLRGFGLFAVIERTSSELIGRVGPFQPEGWPDFEIGWMLRRSSWGHGYATEAALACVEYAFTKLNREHLISVIDPQNHASIRVAERIGERLEGTVELYHRPGYPLLQYGMHRDEWLRRQE